MSDLVPFLSSSTDEVELSLLRSTEDDELDSSALAKTALALGLAAGGVAPAVAAAQLAKGATGVSWLAVVKALLFGMGAGLVVSAGATFAFSEAPRSPSAPAPSAISVARALPAPRPVDVPRGAPPVLTAAEPSAELPAAVSPSRAVTPLAAGDSADSPQPAFAPALPSVAAFEPAPSDSAGAASIAEQIRIVEQARAALAQGRAADALGALDAYRKRWPNGALVPEAAVLAVRAKLALGDRAGAERDARTLVARAPGSRYAAQLRALLGQDL